MFCANYKKQSHKSHGRGEDPHLAILAYATTPLNHSLPSPAELLNSRKYRCILPVQVKQQNHTHRYRNLMQRQKQQQTKYYNRNARDLPSIKTGRPAYVQLVPKTRNWTLGYIIERLSLRTYKVKTYNGGIYIRNRKFIKPQYTDSKQSLQTTRMTTNSKEQLEQLEQPNHYQRPRRTTQKPQRLIEIMN